LRTGERDLVADEKREDENKNRFERTLHGFGDSHFPVSNPLGWLPTWESV
jgi:hypothetical protein